MDSLQRCDQRIHSSSRKVADQDVESGLCVKGNLVECPEQEEEANEWLDGFTAYFKHNEKALQKLLASVHRQILNNSIEAALANALQADDEITTGAYPDSNTSTWRRTPSS